MIIRGSSYYFIYATGALYLLASLLNCADSVQLIRLKILKCRGLLQVSTDKSLPSAFLSREKLEVISEDVSSDVDSDLITICDVIPMPMSKERSDSVFDQFKQKVRIKAQLTSPGKLFTNRDAGLFDNLPFFWRRDLNSRKELYRYLNGGEGINIEGDKIRILYNEEILEKDESFPNSLKSILGCSIVGLFLEAEDELSDNSVRLGSAVILAKIGEERIICHYNVNNT